MDKESKVVAQVMSAGNLPGIEKRKQEIVAQYGPRERFVVFDEDVCFRKIALSGDGNTLAAIAQNVMCVWNTKTGKRTHRFVFNCDIRKISISSDGDYILLTDAVNVIHLVETAFSTVSKITQYPERILSLDLDESGMCAAFGDANGRVTIFDPCNIESSRCIDCEEPAGFIKLHAEENIILVDIERSILAYRLSDHRLMARYGEEECIPSAGDMLNIPVIGRSMTGLRIYDAAAAEIRHEITSFASVFDYTSDGSTIVGGDHGDARVYDGLRGGEINRVKTYVRDIGDIQVDSSGTAFYICGDDASIDYFSTSGNRLGSYVDLCSQIMAAAISDDQRHLVVSDQRGVIAVYDLVSGTVKRYFQHACCISKQTVSGSLVATGAHDHFAKVLDLSTGETVFSVNCGGKPVQGIALDSEGFVITGNMFGMIQKHDIESGEIIAEYHGNISAVRSLDISPCKRYLMSTSDDGYVLVFDYRTGKPVNRLRDSSIIYSGGFGESADFVYFGNGSGDIVKMRTTTAEIVSRWRVHQTTVRSISIAQEKLTSIGICDDAHILDLRTGETVLDCPVETRPFRRVAFLNHDGTRLVTGGQDGRLTIRDTKDGSAVAEMHNLGQGYLWATRGKSPSGGESNWFHTDREDLILVYGQTAGIESLLSPQDSRRKAFMMTHNNQAATMSIAGLCPDARSAELEQALQSVPSSVSDIGTRLLTQSSDNS